MKLLEICSWSNLAPFQPKYCKGRKFTRLNGEWNSLNLKPNCVSLTEQSKLFKTTLTTLRPPTHASHGEVLAKGQPRWHRPRRDLVSISVVYSHSSQTGSALCGLSVTSSLSLLSSINFSHVRKPCHFPRLSCFQLQWLDTTWHTPAERQGAHPVWLQIKTKPYCSAHVDKAAHVRPFLSHFTKRRDKFMTWIVQQILEVVGHPVTALLWHMVTSLADSLSCPM